MELTEKKILVEGNEVSYLDEGTGELTIVFIHGFPFDKWMWANQLRAFRNEYRVIAYDVRGHGKTPGNSLDFSIPQFTNDLFAFLDHLKIDKVIICGLSMGGYIALHAIEQHSDRIEGLILADTQCAADTEEARTKRMKTIESIKEKGLLDYANESVKNLFASASIEKEIGEVGLIKKTILNTKAENVCKTLIALGSRREKCTVIENIKTPTLILVGAEDKITPLAAATKMHNLISSSTLHLIPDAGHVSNLENPDEFNSQVKTFLRSIPNK